MHLVEEGALLHLRLGGLDHLLPHAVAAAVGRNGHMRGSRRGRQRRGLHVEGVRERWRHKGLCAKQAATTTTRLLLLLVVVLAEGHGAAVPLLLRHVVADHEGRARRGSVDEGVVRRERKRRLLLLKRDAELLNHRAGRFVLVYLEVGRHHVFRVRIRSALPHERQVFAAQICEEVFVDALVRVADRELRRHPRKFEENGELPQVLRDVSVQRVVPHLAEVGLEGADDVVESVLDLARVVV